MHNLISLRSQIIKRQVLTTVEVLSKPIAGRTKLTHFITGYVHKPYPPVYADLAREAGFDSACIVRGVEGGVIPSLRQTGKYFHYHDKGAEIEATIDPAALAIVQAGARRAAAGCGHHRGGEDEIVAAIDVKATAHAAAEAGILALKGDKGATYDSLVLAGSIILHHVGKAASIADSGRSNPRRAGFRHGCGEGE
jgi:anthranilate phosphoribosyltransferase